MQALREARDDDGEGCGEVNDDIGSKTLSELTPDDIPAANAYIHAMIAQAHHNLGIPLGYVMPALDENATNQPGDPPYVDCFLNDDNKIEPLGYRLPAMMISPNGLTVGGKVIPRGKLAMMSQCPNAEPYHIDWKAIEEMVAR